MAENFGQTVDALFKGMEEFITTKTVVGEAMHVGDAIVLPLCDVTFGVVASAKHEPQKNNNGGGMGGKMVPTALLVIKDGSTRLININSQDAVSKLLDFVPDIVSRFTGKNAEEDAKVKEAFAETADANEKI